MIKYITLLCIIFHTGLVLACGEIKPNARVTAIVLRLAYPDFPTAADIFAHIRVESSFNPHAINRSGRENSVGLMQVQNGPTDERTNIAMGVSLLREYYKITHSKEGASKAYNIGITAYMKGKYKHSAEKYYRKIKLWRKVYEHYPKKLGHAPSGYSCHGSNNHVHKTVSGHPNSYLFYINKTTLRSHISKWKLQSHEG